MSLLETPAGFAKGRPFLKMHGLGNDFVVLDARRAPLSLDAAAVRAIADRRTGVGCDQLVVLAPATDGADVRMLIRNADGGEVEACGNASRCVAAILFAETGKPRIAIETLAGPITAEAKGTDAAGDPLVAVDMGPARLDWAELPLAAPADTLSLPIAVEELEAPVGVSMGNPHAVFFVADAEAVDLARLGPRLEHHPLFPKRTNVEVVTVMAPDRLRMRVWERGSGITRACGTGACAALVAAARRGLSGRAGEVVLDGGTLHIEWRADGRVVMTGPATTVFSGHLRADLFARIS